MDDSNWVVHTTQRSKRKRAEAACETCHLKKIKCDLQTRFKHGYERCSNCTASKRNCRPRQSKRNRAGSNSTFGVAQPLATGANQRNSSSLPAFDASNIVAVNNENAPLSSGYHERLPPDFETYSPGNTSLLSRAPARDAVSQPDATVQKRLAQDRHNSLSVTSPLRSTHVHDDSQCNTSSDIGFLHVYGPENQQDAISQDVANQARQKTAQVSQTLPLDLLQGFIETYFEHCYTWCPVLDEKTVTDDVQISPMLANALAAAASHIRPPMIPHAGPAAYYSIAKQLFYDDAEPEIMTALKALSLFYWWSPKPPTAVHKNSSWWWQSVIIRHAQQIGVHHEPTLSQSSRPEIDVHLRRRIWWTAYARERLTALCQSKPVIIDPEDCSIGELSLADFPDPAHHRKAEVFVEWVKICDIAGRTAKRLSRNREAVSLNFPCDLAKDLITWISSLPNHLALPIESDRTSNFNRDVHQLHLPYLAVIVVLHLERSAEPFPQAHPPAVMAATCIARILKDVLTRGVARSLMAITCWYTGIAFLGLLSASRVSQLANGANKDLDILTLAIKQLKLMWPTANIFDQGFHRLRSTASAMGLQDSATCLSICGSHRSTIDGTPSETTTPRVITNGIDWIELFPFVTSDTSEVAKELLVNAQGNSFFESRAFPELMIAHFQDLFEPFDDMVDTSFFS